ncbi:major facilitator superfamily domain-containing protein [Aspergillus avenaceus]|uniref:Major facilitator superfamily domain-containing protein n=1 Tax=Aspergillus avenaceus TaxID=36643 RepID=A0A5N6U0K9_ASPAV|nr:major facilitator superfamily domain-containing protein [Aspergillus avenaceus]
MSATVSSHNALTFWDLVFRDGALTAEIIDHPYPGSGTEHDPFIVSWIPNDPRNPLLFREPTKWAITMLVSINTMAAALVSSAFSGGLKEIIGYFDVSEEVALLGISLYVLGFSLGPLLCSPLSELYGRRIVYVVGGIALTIFVASAPGSRNIQALIVFRFIAGCFGSVPMTLPAGVIADMFPALTRGRAMGIFVAAPFLGPTLGPIMGGFIAESAGWKWVQGFLALLVAAIWLATVFLQPETYGPVLLRKRASALQRHTGQVHRSKLEDPNKTAKNAFRTAIVRPWVLLSREPIVLLLSLYTAIVYGVLYMFFAAFPIVYQQVRGWPEGRGALPFLGIVIGILLAVLYHDIIYSKYVKRALSVAPNRLPPEERLPESFFSSIALPIGLFWFAWTNSASVHWMAPTAAGIPFGFGMVICFISVFNYLADSYTIFAASVFAANSLLRCAFGAAFPLFTTYMYVNLGIHWASSIPAFLALACTPMPFLFYKYGAWVRKRCHYAAEADAFLERMLANAAETEPQETEKEDIETGPSK